MPGALGFGQGHKSPRRVIRWDRALVTDTGAATAAHQRKAAIFAVKNFVHASRNVVSLWLGVQIQLVLITTVTVKSSLTVLVAGDRSCICKEGET